MMDNEKYKAPALSKGLDILELLANEARGITQVDIAKTLKRTTPEIFRMLMVLRQRGYVELTNDGDRYALTTKMFEIAHRHPPIRRLTSIAGDEMQRLADKINQSLHLAILHAGKVLVIAQVDCADNNITSVRLGAQIPLFDTASGQVLAAWMDKPKIHDLLAMAGNSEIKHREEFVDGLESVRVNGCCENDSLTIEGVQNISAPIWDFSGNVVAALTIPFIKRLSGTSIISAENSRKALIETCNNISRQLGASVHVK